MVGIILKATNETRYFYIIGGSDSTDVAIIYKVLEPGKTLQEQSFVIFESKDMVFSADAILSWETISEKAEG